MYVGRDPLAPGLMVALTNVIPKKVAIRSDKCNFILTNATIIKQK